jgi:hypothetical protein
MFAMQLAFCETFSPRKVLLILQCLNISMGFRIKMVKIQDNEAGNGLPIFFHNMTLVLHVDFSGIVV